MLLVKVYTNYENRLTGIIDKELVISADPAELHYRISHYFCRNPSCWDQSCDDSGAINEGQSMSVVEALIIESRMWWITTTLSFFKYLGRVLWV